MAVTESNPKAAAKSESPAKTESAAKTDSAAKSSAPAKTEPAAKPPMVAKAEPAAKDESKTAAATTPPSTKRAAAKATPPANRVTGPFWVQVGAFKDPETAKRVATSLRDQNFTVEESDKQVGAKSASAAPSSSAASSPAASPGDLYDVYVSGMSAVELTKRLSAKGLAAEGSGSSVVVKPSLPLRDAVTLSKDLAVDGLKVQVRRAGSGAVAAVPATTTPSPSVSAGETLHRVRVGAFPDAAAARAAAKELEAKGYKPYIARGDE
jgi:cell division septation protein DedD